MNERYSVRQYKNQPFDAALVVALQAEIAAYNPESGPHIQLVTNEPKAFDGFIAHYGNFSGVTDYLAMIVPKCSDLDDKYGYDGDRLVLRAKQLVLSGIGLLQILIWAS